MTGARLREVTTMSGGLQFDEENSRKVESLYLTPDVVAQRHQVLKALALREGERVLDIGSGPGLLANEMAALVGRGGRVCGTCPLQTNLQPLTETPPHSITSSARASAS
jgi:2-polyprenyl-3-methyl-5-hydroxy-6-metoxy-1,4-benzoquinol methylase